MDEEQQPNFAEVNERSTMKYNWKAYDEERGKMMSMDDVLQNPRHTMKLYGDKQFDFGIALKMLKLGYRVHRKGWNGIGMWACLQKGDLGPITKETAEATGLEGGAVVRVLPSFLMKVASAETTLVAWCPSSTDVLAEDWKVWIG